MNACRQKKIEEGLTKKEVEQLTSLFSEMLKGAGNYKELWQKRAAMQMLLFEVEEQIARDSHMEPAVRS